MFVVAIQKGVTVNGDFRNVRVLVKMLVRVMQLCSTLDFLCETCDPLEQCCRARTREVLTRNWLWWNLMKYLWTFSHLLQCH